MLESIFELLLKLEDNERIAPILNFLFKWAWMGPMYIVDNFVLPLTNKVGGVGFIILATATIVGVIYILLRLRKKPVEATSEDELTPDSYFIRDNFS